MRDVLELTQGFVYKRTFNNGNNAMLRSNLAILLFVRTIFDLHIVEIINKRSNFNGIFNIIVQINSVIYERSRVIFGDNSVSKCLRRKEE